MDLNSVLRRAFGVAPLVLLGLYFLLGAIYCYTKGRAAWKYGTVERREQPIAFLSLIILFSAAGVFFLIFALVILAHWPNT